MPTLRVQNLSAGYGDVDILRDVSLEANAGEVVALLGPNGCGKTTLVRCMSRTLVPKSGNITVDNRDLGGMSGKDAARLVAVVPQLEDSVFEFTSREVVAMGRYAHDSTNLHLIDEAMAATGCATLAQRTITQISGGERQRVLIARALAQETPIILLDEPTAHMDVGYQIATLAHLRDLARTGKTIVVVLHDLNLAAGFADRAVLMHAGRIELEGSVDDVLQSEEIDRVYGAIFNRVRDTTSGRLVLTPEFIPETKKTTRPRRIHIVGGGGSAAAILTELWQLGHHLSLGVSLELDSDLDAAQRLHVPAVATPPFSTISSNDIDNAEEVASDAEIVLVCPAPYGMGNLANLDLVSRLQAKGKPILWLDWRQSPWDFTGGEASKKVEGLRSKDGVLWLRGEVANAIENLP